MAGVLCCLACCVVLSSSKVLFVLLLGLLAAPMFVLDCLVWHGLLGLF